MKLRCKCGYGYEGPIDEAPIGCPQCGRLLRAIDMEQSLGCDCGWRGKLSECPWEDGYYYCPNCGSKGTVGNVYRQRSVR